MVRTLRIMVATCLLLAAGNAVALGLGQIEVKSRINQPLLAEIPIISTTPGELEALQARLASPDTFGRVGLAPPSGIAADLQFSLGSDARGRPVIRVTTVAPVTQAVMNFLIEVDWGQGRLVREYSALIDAPRTASAPVQPAIAAPVAAVPNAVQRPVAPVTAEEDAEPAPASPAPVAAAPVPAARPVAEPLPPPSAIAPTPAPAPQPTRAAPAAPAPVSAPPASTASQYGPVKAGETLSDIAAGIADAGAQTLDQTMLALLRANPDAFLGDNINRLKRGAVLRIPDAGERADIAADEAQLVVRQQMQQWREARRAVPQPVAAAGEEPASEATAPAPAMPATRTARAPRPAARAAAGQAGAQARLQIVPASVPGKATGTRSGTSAGGEGSMLQQQLRQRDEDLAARNAEIGELKERVAELEKLRQQQEQLLTLKDSELAAAQQRLADARTASTPAAATPATPAAATTTAPAQAGPATQATQPVPEPPAKSTGPMPWLWGGLAVLGLGLLAWLMMRRRPAPAPPARRRGFDSEALAASLRASGEAAGVGAAVAMPPEPASTEPAALDDGGETAPEPDRERVIDIADIPSTPAPRVETPTWHSGRWVKTEPEAPAPEPASPRFVPTESDAPALVPPSPQQRVRLARAFLDIGDEESARQLLRELVVDVDPAARAEAAKLLRDLG